MKLFFKNT